MKRLTINQQLEDPDSLTKFQRAGRAATETVGEIVKAVRPGVTLRELVGVANEYLATQSDAEWAMPPTVSRNEVVGFQTPSDEKVVNGDLLKIDVGVAVGGYPATLAYTHLVTDAPIPADDPRARVLAGVIEASKRVLDLCAPDTSNLKIVEAIHETAKEYGCEPTTADIRYPHAPGVISYQISHGVIDGMNEDEDEDVHKLILVSKDESYDYSLRDVPLEEYDTFAFDIAFSSGSGKLSECEEPPTIFRRTGEKYALKLKTSREALRQFPPFFPLDTTGRNTRFRLGMKELQNHRLVESYPAMKVEKGEVSARVKFTVTIRRKNKRNRAGRLLLAAKPASAELKKIETQKAPDHSSDPDPV